MINTTIYDKASAVFKEHFNRSHAIAAHAPGRIEALGNHTDYNEGFVLSAAINMGVFFLSAPRNDTACRIVAVNVKETAEFDLSNTAPSKEYAWRNYIKGVLAQLMGRADIKSGFDGVIMGDIPVGAGLSSSAALEMASGLALCALYNIEMDKLALAGIGQTAEHEYAGVKCGMLDQISSLFGRENELVMSDFRSLKIENVPLGNDACFLVCDTNVKHSLVDSEYNERRGKCEEASRFFASALDHPVSALRDVTWDEWRKHSPEMDATAARRAAHVIGENARVIAGREHLLRGDIEKFGELMFESHESSRTNFENSCPELDFLVAEARRIPGALGARLSGGGFGGSAVVLLHPRDTEHVSRALSLAYKKEFGRPCVARVIRPSSGAGLVMQPG